MKSWADHCSSDEESLDDLPEQMEAQKLADVEPVDATTDGPPPTTTSNEDEVDGPAAEDAPPAAPRTYDFPDKAPFTAFIGNLAYSLKDPEELTAAVKQCALEVLGQDITILGARISFGRDGSHRGFGYLEVETLDELKLLMQLNDGKGTIAGRKVQLDTANGNQNKRGAHQRRQQGDSNVDGSRFRGGKYNNNRRNNNNNNNSNKEEGPPKERPSLKLAPRTKPKEEEKGESQGPSDIFGGAKARDAQAWEESRKSSRQQNGDNQQKNDGDRRRSNQGGRGGRGGRTGGRGNANSSSNNNNSEGGAKRAPQGKREPKQKQISPEEKAAAAAAKAAEVAAPAPAAPAKPAAPTNKFALLMDSDSD